MIFALGWELGRNEIIKAVVKEFIRRKLHKKYSKEIGAWEKYMREQKFAKKLDKQMKEEIKRFQRTIEKWTPKELEEFVIEGLDCLKE